MVREREAQGRHPGPCHPAMPGDALPITGEMGDVRDLPPVGEEMGGRQFKRGEWRRGICPGIDPTFFSFGVIPIPWTAWHLLHPRP